MGEFRRVLRLAKWWQGCIMLLITAVFYALIRHQLASTSRGTIHYALIPIFGVWVYVTLVVLVNRRSLVVNGDGVAVGNGPLPVGRSERVPREQIACFYHFDVQALNDESEGMVTFDSLTGVETRDGRYVGTQLDFKSPEEARVSATEMARILGVPVRDLTGKPPTGVDRKQLWVRGGVIVAALLAGAIWEVVSRL